MTTHLVIPNFPAWSTDLIGAFNMKKTVYIVAESLHEAWLKTAPLVGPGGNQWCSCELLDMYSRYPYANYENLFTESLTRYADSELFFVGGWDN